MVDRSHRKTDEHGALMDLVETWGWPEDLKRLVRGFAGPERARARGEFWLLLNLALAQRLRILSGRYYRIDSESLRDLAAEKALELVDKLDRGQWNPLESHAGELVSFLSTVARNALVDELRRTKRTKLDPAGMIETAPEGDGWNRDAACHGVEREEFVSQLVACAARLSAPHRIIWLLRVLHEMPSKTIAEHPEVLLKSSHVDVILSRCRDQIRQCMRARGLDAHELPPGTFAELWRRFRANPISGDSSHD